MLHRHTDETVAPTAPPRLGGYGDTACAACYRVRPADAGIDGTPIKYKKPPVYVTAVQAAEYNGTAFELDQGHKGFEGPSFHKIGPVCGNGRGVDAAGGKSIRVNEALIAALKRVVRGGGGATSLDDTAHGSDARASYPVAVGSECGAAGGVEYHASGCDYLRGDLLGMTTGAVGGGGGGAKRQRRGGGSGDDPKREEHHCTAANSGGGAMKMGEDAAPGAAGGGSGSGTQTAKKKKKEVVPGVLMARCGSAPCLAAAGAHRKGVGTIQIPRSDGGERTLHSYFGGKTTRSAETDTGTLDGDMADETKSTPATDDNTTPHVPHASLERRFRYDAVCECVKSEKRERERERE